MQHELRDIITPAVEALGFHLWGYELIRHAKFSELWVYVDSENGITLGECAEVSRQISAVLDVADPISSAYQLQVSSPGMDRRLFVPEHYEQYINSKIKVRTRVALEGAKNFVGVLIAVEGKSITLLCDQDKQIQLQLDQIEKAHVVPEF